MTGPRKDDNYGIKNLWTQLISLDIEINLKGQTTILKTFQHKQTWSKYTNAGKRLKSSSPF